MKNETTNRKKMTKAEKAATRVDQKRMAPFQLSGELIAYLQHLSEVSGYGLTEIAEPALWAALPSVEQKLKSEAEAREARRQAVVRIINGGK